MKLKAWAAGYHSWNGGDTLTAADLNGNFTLVETAITALQAQLDAGGFTVLSTDGGVSHSVGATRYCGLSAPTYTGNLGGYSGAKAICQTACSSPTAHMCTAEEMIRTEALGIAIPYSNSGLGGWVATGLSAGPAGGSGLGWNDCNGWTSTASSDFGNVWISTPVAPGYDNCNPTTVRSVVCCD